jgi:RecA-family ATPase
MAQRTRDRFRLFTLAQVDALPPPSWLIDGLLPTNALCVLYGKPGSGKTFIGLSMALHCATGRAWCGKRTTGAIVLYIAAEGVYGLKLRIAAHRKCHGVAGEIDRMWLVSDRIDLLSSDDIDELRAALKSAGIHPDLIIFDTLARMMPGGDENSSKDMGQVIANIDALRGGATALVVHHTGKSGGRERGSSALAAAADVMMKCTGRPSAGQIRL